MKSLHTEQQKSRVPVGSTAGRVPEATLAVSSASPNPAAQACSPQHGHPAASHSCSNALSFKKQYFHQNVTILTPACCPVRVDNPITPARHWGRSWGAAPQLGTKKLPLQSEHLLHQQRAQLIELVPKGVFSPSSVCVITSYMKIAR